MMVRESNAFSFGNKAFTVLRMDEAVPLTSWRNIIVGGNEYEPVFHSGLDKHSICINGNHALNGAQVSFV